MWAPDWPLFLCQPDRHWAGQWCIPRTPPFLQPFSSKIYSLHHCPQGHKLYTHYLQQSQVKQLIFPPRCFTHSDPTNRGSCQLLVWVGALPSTHCPTLFPWASDGLWSASMANSPWGLTQPCPAPKLLPKAPSPVWFLQACILASSFLKFSIRWPHCLQ